MSLARARGADQRHWVLASSNGDAMFRVNRRPTHPGVILRTYYLAPRGLTVTELARASGLTRKHVSNIVNGSAAISPESAVRISEVLGTTPQLWLNLQTRVDLHDARRKLKSWRPGAIHSAPAER
ncbi:MAG: HigA family addiction module antitoxin [Rhodospirillales bacterium]|nr:HigA family addiction module antitoxin [Rhodospirillales bacterium]